MSYELVFFLSFWHRSLTRIVDKPTRRCHPSAVAAATWNKNKITPRARLKSANVMDLVMGNTASAADKNK